jgi:hypothetical protein
VGESNAELRAALPRFAPLLPAERLRYLMGVGRPADVLAAIAAGFDVFDCVLPTRNARHGMLFTRAGPLQLKNARWREATGPSRPAATALPAPAGLRPAPTGRRLRCDTSSWWATRWPSCWPRRTTCASCTARRRGARGHRRSRPAALPDYAGLDAPAPADV